MKAAAASLIELERDARQLGCAAEVAAGSELFCDRVNRLRPGGPAGRSLIEDKLVVADYFTAVVERLGVSYGADDIEAARSVLSVVGGSDLRRPPSAG